MDSINLLLERQKPICRKILLYASPHNVANQARVSLSTLKLHRVSKSCEIRNHAREARRLNLPCSNKRFRLWFAKNALTI